MKSTSVAEFLPQWTKFVVTDLSGRDPLGLASVATSITDHLLPGIVVATDRARYYAIYSWILANIRRTEKTTTDNAFAEAFQQRESVFAIATLLNNEKTGMVGLRAVQKELENFETEIRTGFRVLPSNDLGGFGQYYSGSLYNLGLTHRPEGDFDQVTEGRGERLANAIERTIQSTPWVTEAGFLKRKIALETIRTSADRLTLDAIREPCGDQERTLLTEVFFGLDSEEFARPLMRRQSLARILDVLKIYRKNSVSLGSVNGTTLDHQLVLAPSYFGSLMDADGNATLEYVPPAYLATCSAMWRQFCLHEIVSWVLDSLLSALLDLLAEAPDAGRDIGEVVERLSGNELQRAIERYSGVAATTPGGLFAGIGVTETPTNASCNLARLKFTLKAELNENMLMRAKATTPVEILARALPCLAILYAKWRDGSDDQAWASVRAMVGPQLAATTLLPRIDGWLSPTTDWVKAVRDLLELVIVQHDRIMYEKGKLEACWLHHEGDRLVHDQDHSAGYPAHASRHRSALGILFDLKLVEKDGEGRYCSTSEGDKLLARVSEMGR